MDLEDWEIIALDYAIFDKDEWAKNAVKNRVYKTEYEALKYRADIAANQLIQENKQIILDLGLDNNTKIDIILKFYNTDYYKTKKERDKIISYNRELELYNTKPFIKRLFIRKPKLEDK